MIYAEEGDVFERGKPRLEQDVDLIHYIITSLLYKRIWTIWQWLNVGKGGRWPDGSYSCVRRSTVKPLEVRSPIGQ